MNAPSAPTAYERLVSLDRLIREQGRVLPQERKRGVLWSGVSCRVGEWQVLVPLGELSEMLPPPSIRPAPGAKPWVLGISNLRGVLHPVFDLHGFLFGLNAGLGRHDRLIISNERESPVAWRVSQVFGLRHFDSDLRQAPRTSLDSTLRPHVPFEFPDLARTLPVLSLVALANSPALMEVVR